MPTKLKHVQSKLPKQNMNGTVLKYRSDVFKELTCLNVIATICSIYFECVKLDEFGKLQTIVVPLLNYKLDLSVCLNIAQTSGQHQVNISST